MFQAIGKVIEVKTANTGLARSLEAAVVLAKVTELGAGRWQAARFRNGRLLLTAPSAIAAHELVLRRAAILAEINTMFGSEVVKQLSIRS